MRAPIYRNIEARSTFLGLAFPTEVAAVAGAFWTGMLLLPPLPASAVTLGVYLLIRLATWRRAPQFLQHWLIVRVRRLRTGGRLSAAARSRAPSFPHARRHFRDLPRRAYRLKEVTGGGEQPSR